ncbi:MAG: hypothetical protein CVV42_13715 [Candidatus Riflebacteria bacterium HGW-Riflebacteria-2]|jgi:hypothetical protein|nr:MAG: hypothetical protein CVV42_13715 [Candidatus Riflebacteria bacterium HGW-Riflebacteria-2]
MKWAKIIALIVACTFGIFAFAAWRSMLTLRQGMADCLIWQSASLSERFILDEETSHEMVSAVKIFADNIAHGTQPGMSGFAILRAFYDGPLLLALMHTSIINRLSSIEAPEDFDRQNAEKVSRQFFSAVKDQRISAETWQKTRAMLLEKKLCQTESSIGFVIPEQIEGFRKKIGLKTLSECIVCMQQALTAADLADTVSILDPVIELKKILNSDNAI